MRFGLQWLTTLRSCSSLLRYPLLAVVLIDQSDEQIGHLDRTQLQGHVNALRSYFAKHSERLREANALEFWKSVRKDDPIVALLPLARMYLSIPATSCSSESAFSSGGYLNDGRERLTVEHLEDQLVVRDQLLEWRSLDEATMLANVDRLTAPRDH